MKASYNIGALLNQGIDDLEVCQDLRLDPALAYTKGINPAAAQVIYDRNINDAMKDGISKEDAMKEASEIRDNTRKLYTTLLQRNPKGVVVK